MRFAVIGSAHAHIYEFIEDMLKMEGSFAGVFNDGTAESAIIAQKYKTPLLSTMEQIFEKNIDIAGTAAVTAERIKIIEACSQKGVHIITAKPAVIDNEQYRRLENVITKGNIEVGMMLPLRFLPQIACIKQLIDTHRIGRLLSVEIFNPHKLLANSRPSWFFEKSRSGGIINDLLIHSIDLYHWLSNSEITDYTGCVKKCTMKEKEDFFDTADFFVRSNSGVSGYFRTDMHMTDTHWTWGDLRVFCTGSRGMIEARVLGDPLTRVPMVILFEEGKPTREVDCTMAYNSSTRDLVERINKRPGIIDHSVILKASKLALDFDGAARKIEMLNTEAF